MQYKDVRGWYAVQRCARLVCSEYTRALVCAGTDVARELVVLVLSFETVVRDCR